VSQDFLKRTLIQLQRFVSVACIFVSIVVVKEWTDMAQDFLKRTLVQLQRSVLPLN
jgi:hypothetical protein